MADGDFDVGSLLDQVSKGKFGVQVPPQAIVPAPTVAAPATISNAPTGISQEDYGKLLAPPLPGEFPTPGKLPELNLPQIDIGGDPSKAYSPGGAGGLFLLPAKGTPAAPAPVTSHAVIDVGGATPDAKPFSVEDTLHQATQGKLPVPPKPPEQMTGIARQLALPASAMVSGLTSTLGFPGDVARGAMALANPTTEAPLQGNPFPELPPDNPKAPFQPITPNMLFLAGGKIPVQAASGHNPIDSETLLGLTKRMGVTDRPDLQPQGTLEHLESGAATGVGMVAPTLLTGGAASVPTALRLARQGAAMGLGMEAGGAVGGAVGGKPGAVIGAGLGGLAPGAAAAGITKLYGAAKPLLDSALPITATQKKNVAARSFAPANTVENVSALKAAAELVPGSPATSYQVTGDPFLGAQERGIANRIQYKPEFDELRQQQNAARVATIQGQAPADADVGGIVPWFQGRLSKLSADEDAALASERAATQNTVDAMGNPIAPHEAGAVVRGAVEGARAPAVAASDEALAAAQARAERATAGLGGEAAPNAGQAHGERMRGEGPSSDTAGTGLEGKRNPVHDAASKLYDAVDPEGKLALNVSEVGKTARELEKEVNPRMGGKLDPHEVGPLEAASKLRGVELFSDLRALRENVSQALRDIQDKAGRPFRRMSILMDSIDRTMAVGAGEAAKNNPTVAEKLATMAREEAHGPVAGEGSGRGGEVGPGGGPGGVPGASGTEGAGARGPGPVGGDRTVAVGPTSPGRKAPTIQDRIIELGGVQDQGGELRANDLHLVHHQRGGRLVNPNGMPPDQMRRLLSQPGGGYLPPNSDINDFLNAVIDNKPAISRQADSLIAEQASRQRVEEEHARFMAGANIDEAVSQLGVRLSPEERARATELTLHGTHPEDAVRQAVHEGEEFVLQRNAEHNAVGSPGVPLAAQQGEMSVDRPQLTPNFTPADRAALRSANAAWADYKERFGKGAVGNVLRRSSIIPGGYKVPDSGVPLALFAKGPKGAEAADSLISAMGSKEDALKVLGDYPAYSLRQAAEEMGTLNVKKYNDWMTAHAAVLDKFPELKASFDTAAKARAVLDDLKRERVALDASNPIKASATNAEVMGQYAQPGPKGYEAAEKLIRDTNGSPAALKATEDYLAEVLRRGEGSAAGAEITSGPNAGTLDPGRYAAFMRRYNSFLSHPALADLKARFDTAAAAQASLDKIAAEQTVARREYETSVARHFLPQDTDPVSAVGKILGSGSASSQMADLARLTSADPAAREAIQAAVIKFMMRRLESNNPVGADLTQTYLKANDTQNFIRQHIGVDGEGALRHIMAPEQLKALGDVAMDIRRANLSISGNKAPGGSDTGLITSSREADTHEPHLAGTLAVMETLGEAGKHTLGPLGHIGSIMAVPILQAARRRGYADINALRAEALLHPEKMSALLARLPTEAEVPSRIAAITSQIMKTGVLPAVRTTNDNQQIEPRSAVR